MEDEELDELLALLSDADARSFPTVEELFRVDSESIGACGAPRVALERDSAGVLTPWRGIEQSNEPPSADENDKNGDSAGSSSPETKSSAVRRSTERKRRTNKDELTRLHAEVAHLMAHLIALKSAAGISIDTPVARVPAPKDGVLAASAAIKARRGLSLWKKLAARQLARRQASEQMNQALLEAVKEQTRRAKQLRSLLQKRVIRANHEFASILHKPEALIPHSLPDDERVFERLIGWTDEAYTAADLTLSEAKMHEVLRPGRLSSGRGLGPGRWSVEIRDVYVVPFDLKQTERALWSYLSQGAIQHGNEIRSSLQFLFQLPVGIGMTMQQRSVARRYREQERTIVIQRSLTQPMDDVSVHATHYIVVKSGEESISDPTTVIETYVSGSGSAPVETLAWVDEEVHRHQQSNPNFEKDDFGLKMWARSISIMHAEIEDALVEQSAGGIQSY